MGSETPTTPGSIWDVIRYDLERLAESKERAGETTEANRIRKFAADLPRQHEAVNAPASARSAP